MLSKSSLKKLNLVILISIFIISISPIVFSGVIYRKTDMIFANKGSWRHTAALQVSTVSVIFFNTIVSFLYLIVFSNNKIFGIISIIITLLSSLLSIAIGIFELVGSVVYNNELTQSCSEDYYGFFETFRYMESYFKVADQLLCSKECPCKFKKIKGYDDFKYGNNGFIFGIVLLISFGGVPVPVSLVTFFGISLWSSFLDMLVLLSSLSSSSSSSSYALSS